jgi:hypothetical protein
VFYQAHAQAASRNGLEISNGFYKSALTLTEEEDRTLSELRQAQSVPYRTRDRAHMLRLNAQGMNVPAIAEVFQCHQQTVRATLKRWEQGSLGIALKVVWSYTLLNEDFTNGYSS